MAPTVSPKKSWEGFVGSLVATAAGGALMLYLMFDVALWYGAVFGLSVSVASVLGDLAEVDAQTRSQDQGHEQSACLATAV